ncbi:MAG: acyl carrier protein [Oscillospiraceae bacterium]|nr:acyl carrier protein [Oscillospiraceae bacterium]
MKEYVFKQIQTVLNEKSLIIQYDSNLGDILDSITFIKIVVALEGEFGFEFDDEMLLITKFPTVKSMIEYVESKVNDQL